MCTWCKHWLLQGCIRAVVGWVTLGDISGLQSPAAPYPRHQTSMSGICDTFQATVARVFVDLVMLCISTKLKKDNATEI